MTSVVPIESIANKIVFLRGEKVLLDHYLAELYGVETKVLKQAVRRNIKRFPDDFMFELTKEENQSLRSQNVTLKCPRQGRCDCTRRNYLPVSEAYKNLRKMLSVKYRESKSS